VFLHTISFLNFLQKGPLKSPLHNLEKGMSFFLRHILLVLASFPKRVNTHWFFMSFLENNRSGKHRFSLRMRAVEFLLRYTNIFVLHSTFTIRTQCTTSSSKLLLLVLLFMRLLSFLPVTMESMLKTLHILFWQS